MMKAIKCPICGKKVAFNIKRDLPPNFPFCSKRCKLIDLGKWLNEEYTIDSILSEDSISENDKKRNHR
ncbi:MAG: DNA gyrase inhibitor YacG [Candidatus Poribacteria bacterium]